MWYVYKSSQNLFTPSIVDLFIQDSPVVTIDSSTREKNFEDTLGFGDGKEKRSGEKITLIYLFKKLKKKDLRD